MTITIDLPEDTPAALKAEAKAQGRNAEDVAAEHLAAIGTLSGNPCRCARIPEQTRFRHETRQFLYRRAARLGAPCSPSPARRKARPSLRP